MKKLIIILLVFGFYMAGCSEESIVNSSPLPVQSNYQLIKLPVLSSLQVNNSYSDTKQISGSQGGYLSFQESYSGGSYGTVTINSTLEFPAGSFSGTKTLTMTADDEYCASSFFPGMSFSKSGIYNITYTGVNVTGINPTNVEFAYLKSNGDLEYPDHDSIIVDITTGKLQVINARLTHFSRYGFVNKTN